MSKNMKHHVALLLLALLAFAQVNPAVANCGMGDMGMATMSGTVDQPCDGCETPCSSDQTVGVCATDCAVSEQPVSVLAPVSTPVLQRPLLALSRPGAQVRPSGLDGPPSGAPPRRILLHSFLI